MCCHNNVDLRKLHNEEDIKFDSSEDQKKYRLSTEKNYLDKGGNKGLLGKDILETKNCPINSFIGTEALVNRMRELELNVNSSDYLTLKVWIILHNVR